MILLRWLAEVALAGWLYGVRDPAGYGVLLVVALLIGLVLSHGLPDRNRQGGR